MESLHACPLEFSVISTGALVKMIFVVGTLTAHLTDKSFLSAVSRAHKHTRV